MQGSGSCLELAPSGLFVQADTECSFRYHFMRKERIGRMDSTQACVAEQSLVTSGTKEAEAADYIQSHIHNPPGAFDCAVFGCKDFCRPESAMIYAIRPVLSDRLQMRSDGFEFDDHFSDGVLDLRVICHGTGQTQSSSVLHSGNTLV